MGVRIRQADLSNDRQTIVDFIRQNLNKESNDARFEWLYLRNPCGPARAWIAYSDAQEIVGLASAFPRWFRSGAARKLGMVLGDFCICPEYRSLGPALQLQRECLALVDGQAVSFSYDFPSQSMISVYRRLGVTTQHQMARLAKLLRVDSRVRKLIRFSAVSTPVSGLGNFVLSLGDRSLNGRSSFLISRHQEACGEEFTKLSQDWSRAYGTCVARTADYLNWRYREHPVCRYEILTARQNNVLRAYAVFTQTGDHAYLADVFGALEPPVLRPLVGEMSRVLRKRGVSTVSAPLMLPHPLSELLFRMGFRKREYIPVVFYPSSPVLAEAAGEAGVCFLIHGDRDS